jgi:hypothetical protein
MTFEEYTKNTYTFNLLRIGIELNWIGIRDVRTVQEEFQQNKQPAARSHFWHLSGFTNYDKMKKKS